MTHTNPITTAAQNMARPLWLAVQASLVLAALIPAGAAASTYSATVVRDVSGASPFSACTADLGEQAAAQPDTEFEAQLAVDPTDPARLAGVYQQDLWSGAWFARGAGAAASSDGGASWQTSVLPGLTVCSGGSYRRVDSPSVVFGPTGTAHSIALARTNTPRGRDSAVMVNRSGDGGRSWDAPVTLFSDTDQLCHYGGLSIIADGADERYVYATWSRGRFPGDSEDWNHGNPASLRSDMFFARSVDGGRTWEPARRIFEPRSNQSARFAELVVLPDGDLLSLFALHIGSGKNRFASRLAVMRSSDRGATWSAPATIGAMTNQAVVDPDDGERVRTAEFRPDAAVDATTGRIFVTWQDAGFSDGERSAIALVSSSDGGLTWSSARQVNAAPSAQAFNPAIAVAADGTVAVSYSDFRDDVADPDVLGTAVWLSHSHDGGATWSEEQLDGFDLQRAPMAWNGLFLGDNHGLAALPDGFGVLYARPSATDAASIRFVRATH